MAPLLSAPTAKEKVQLDALQKAYEKLIEHEKRAPAGSAQLIQALEEIAHPKTSVGRGFTEINLELVVRDARNFRNTKLFRQTLLRWVRDVQSDKSGDIYVEMFCSGGKERLWIVGIILYYKQRIQDLLVRTSFFKDVFGGEKVSGATELVDRHMILSSHDVAQIFREVEAVDVDSLCRSSSFQEAITLLPKMMQSFSIATQFVALTATPSAFLPMNKSPESDPHLILAQQLSNQSWMHLLFVMMRAAQFMHDVRTVSKDSGVAPPALDGLPSADGIQKMFTTISDILNEVFTSSASGVMTVLSLRFARSACATYFPSVSAIELIDASHKTQMDALRGATPGHLDMPTNRTYAQLTTDVLWRYLAIDAPAFVEKKRSFMGSGVHDQWVTTVLFRQLYLYRYPDGSQGAPADANAAGCVFYDREEKDIVESAQHTHLFLYRCLVTVLRPLFHQLLVAQPPKEVAPSAEAAPGAADAEAAALMANYADGVAAARRAILEVARTVDAIDVHPTVYILREWETLEVGPQPRARCSIGKACFEKAVAEVLGDLMKFSLVWLTQPPASWATFFAAPAKANSMVPDECEVPILRFLMRTERVYHALTDATANAESNNMAAGGVDTQPLPDALQACKGFFHAAVLQALERYYPFNARNALVVPLINSIHNYLMDREHRAGAGAAGVAARPPPRPGAKKMPPPPPGSKVPPSVAAGGGPSAGGPGGAHPVPRQRHEVVPLTSQQDLYTALRLMGCTATDVFFQKYREMLHARLLSCPPPNRVTSDEDFDARRHTTEDEANAYIRLLVGNNIDELRTIREICAMFRRSVDVVAGIKMVISALPWNLWPLSESMNKLAAPLTSEVRAHTTNPTLAPAPDAPLPFPADLSRAMDTYVSQREGALTSRQLHWYGSVNSTFTTFELRYPRDAGRATTIHGTLLLQQLFLAITQYGRRGVPLGTLASRAKLTQPDLERVLRPAIHRDHLLTVSGDIISLNYDFERPEANKNGVFTHWPPPQQVCTRIDKEAENAIYKERITYGEVEVTRIMKSMRTCTFKALEETAREKLAARFALTTRLFKDIINRLIEKKYLERGSTEEELNYLA